MRYSYLVPCVRVRTSTRERGVGDGGFPIHDNALTERNGKVSQKLYPVLVSSFLSLDLVDPCQMGPSTERDAISKQSSLPLAGSFRTGAPYYGTRRSLAVRQEPSCLVWVGRRTKIPVILGPLIHLINKPRQQFRSLLVTLHTGTWFADEYVLVQVRTAWATTSMAGPQVTLKEITHPPPSTVKSKGGFSYPPMAASTVKDRWTDPFIRCHRATTHGPSYDDAQSWVATGRSKAHQPWAHAF